MMLLRFVPTLVLVILSGSVAGAQEPTQNQAGESETIQRIGGNWAAARMVNPHQEPEYPKIARQAGIGGIVLLDIVVDDEGKVKNITPTAGHPVLIPPAMEAVKTWRYKPMSVEGKPVPFQSDVTVNFVLRQDDTVSLYLDQEGTIRHSKPDVRFDKEQLKQFAKLSESKRAILNLQKSLPFSQLEETARSVVEAGFVHIEVPHHAWHKGKLYVQTSNPGAPNGPDLDVSGLPGIVLPPDGAKRGKKVPSIFQLFAGKDGTIEAIIHWSGELVPEVAKQLQGLRLKSPVLRNEEPVPASFFLQLDPVSGFQNSKDEK